LWEFPTIEIRGGLAVVGASMDRVAVSIPSATIWAGSIETSGGAGIR
jgi:hypothetical protein